MEPVRTADCDTVYRGPTPDVGDLWCQRVRPGMIRSFWRPSEADLAILNGGGCIQLDLHNEPIPPIGITVAHAEATQPVDDHPFKVDSPPPAPPKPGPPQPPDHGKARRHG